MKPWVGESPMSRADLKIFQSTPEREETTFFMLACNNTEAMMFVFLFVEPPTISVRTSGSLETAKPLCKRSHSWMEWDGLPCPVACRTTFPDAWTKPRPVAVSHEKLSTLEDLATLSKSKLGMTLHLHEGFDNHVARSQVCEQLPGQKFEECKKQAVVLAFLAKWQNALSTRMSKNSEDSEDTSIGQEMWAYEM